MLGDAWRVSPVPGGAGCWLMNFSSSATVPETGWKYNKMELLQSQAPAERELLGNSADRTLEIGV